MDLTVIKSSDHAKSKTTQYFTVINLLLAVFDGNWARTSGQTRVWFPLLIFKNFTFILLLNYLYTFIIEGFLSLNAWNPQVPLLFLYKLITVPSLYSMVVVNHFIIACLSKNRNGDWRNMCLVVLQYPRSIYNRWISAWLDLITLFIMLASMAKRIVGQCFTTPTNLG